MSEIVCGSLDYRLFAKRMAIIAKAASEQSSNMLAEHICLTEKISLAEVKNATLFIRHMLDIIERDANAAAERAADAALDIRGDDV